MLRQMLLVGFIVSVQLMTTNKKVHKEMGHPGISRLTHYMQTKFGIKSSALNAIVSNCAICARMKPRFVKLPLEKLIRASHPWQRLAIDFVGPK